MDFARPGIIHLSCFSSLMPIFRKYFVNSQIDIVKMVCLFFAIVLVPIGMGTWDAGYRYWGGRNLADFLLWIIFCSVLAYALKRAKVRFAPMVLIGFLVLYLAAGIGFGQAAATLYFSISAYWLGRLISYVGFRGERERLMLVESLMLGGGTYIALFGLLIHFPVNYNKVYVAILALPILLACLLKLPSLYRPRAMLAWQCACANCSGASYRLVVLAVIVIGYVARFAFFPTINYDDNALHLRMWSLLSTQHVFDFDVRTQIWLVAPFAVDLLHSVISLVAQADSRAAMNLALLAFLLYCMWKLTRLINRSINERLLVLVLFATTPLTASLLTGLQTELMLAVLATAGTLLVLDRQEGLVSTRGAALVMVAALCAATKLPGAVLGIVLLAALVLERFLHRKRALPAPQSLQWLALLAVFLIASFVAFHSYLVAWHVTANPLFPLYNGIFKSPFFGPYNFLDTRYVTGVSWKSYWELFFNTARHYESKNFVAGFQYLLLLPLAIVLLLFFGRERPAVRILLPLLGFGFVMFSAVQYWRYLFPVLPLASVLIGALFYGAAAGVQQKRSHKMTAITILAFACINMFFFPGISWYFDKPAGDFYSQEKRKEILAEFMPEQFFNAYINQEAPGAGVLFEDGRPFGATLLASPTYVNWYAPATSAQAGTIRTDADMTAFLRQHKIRYVYWDLTQAIDESNPYRSSLRAHLSRFGEPLSFKGGVVMYRLHEEPLLYRDVVRIGDFTAYTSAAAGASAEVSEKGELLLGSTPFVLKEFDTGMSSIALYSASLACPDKGGSLIAQINWNVGPVYYRSIKCNKDALKVGEAIPIPAGASHGTLIVTARDTASMVLKELAVGLR